MMRATINAMRIVNGMGEPDPDGSYVEFVVQRMGLPAEHVRMSLGGAETLEAELHGILKVTNDARG